MFSIHANALLVWKPSNTYLSYIHLFGAFSYTLCDNEVDEALSHPYLSSLHEINEEPICPSPFAFDFEQASSSEEDIKELIWQESVNFNPEVE